ncbi:glycoside hydrolase family 127 protein [Lacticaseibacillus zhaodongensis]|uniref:glycoside hydrolase family 127 protein n=1 Tax=Lacticaseibacillus zhaodongensis TaxID=2668065 RepID=UPI0012D2E728|nr:beta-L-arabinofuranosidase domain-containing protein [Lacticaseibacillus zhaodongensis]
MQINKVELADSFWDFYRDAVRTKMLPYQWRVINDEVPTPTVKSANPYLNNQPSHAIRNLRIAAGEVNGHFSGYRFQDSDVYKWLEAVAYVLEAGCDEELKAHADAVVALVGRAQATDGYLDTYIQIDHPEAKFKHVSMSHELYVMGHYIEAGVAYNHATGNQAALMIARKMADCLDHNFGPEAGKMHGYPGHPEIELALAKLADATGAERYYKLAAYMLDQRGKQPDNFFHQQSADRRETGSLDELDRQNAEPEDDYFQNDRPIRALKRGEGHAVRMVYLLTGMARVARHTHDAELLAKCAQIWRHITNRQMYITGGIGADPWHEGFGPDYYLPNSTAYCETCAACGMVFFTQQLLLEDPQAEYADLIERELYNGIISGMALDAEHFFYVNPLAVDPAEITADKGREHVLPERPSWLACACCPPNLARVVAALHHYIYTSNADTVYVQQFISSRAQFANGVTVAQVSALPWNGKTTLTVTAPKPSDFTLAIRVPYWCNGQLTVTIDGIPGKTQVDADGYCRISRSWDDTTKVNVEFAMAPRLVWANPRVAADVNKVAIQNGPIVYAAEEVDNGPRLATIAIDPYVPLRIGQQVPIAMGKKVPAIQLDAVRKQNSGKPFSSVKPVTESMELTLIPYFAWANRGVNEMTVWLNEKI